MSELLLIVLAEGKMISQCVICLVPINVLFRLMSYFHLNIQEEERVRKLT